MKESLLKPFDLFIHNTAEVLTCDGDVRHTAEAALAPIKRGAVGISNGQITWLGTDVPSHCINRQTQQLDALGGFVGPGFVDCHTHVVFAGDRSQEFEARCQGRSYLEIAAAGGGIAHTVRATRAATAQELVDLALPRLNNLLHYGVTTAEVKSGYGLSVEDELKLLEVIRTLQKCQPVSLIATVLGLHAPPPDSKQSRDAYVREVVDELLPRVAQSQLAKFCDVFVEQSAFTHEEARACLTAAKRLGFAPRLHVDQLTPNAGAQLAAELGAITADHLEQISAQGIAALKQSGTIAVLAPTSTLFMRVRPYAPGRTLIDAGVPVALCSNYNPGSSNSGNVFLALGLACIENGMSPAEAYLGFTRMGGLALGDASLGRLTVGSPADLIVFRVESYRALPYHFAMNDVRHVVKAGRLVV